jgi:hypothetical protein
MQGLEKSAHELDHKTLSSSFTFVRFESTSFVEINFQQQQ